MSSLEQERLLEIKQILRVIINWAAVPLFLIFWFLDLIYVPQLRWEFLGLRVLIIPMALLAHWWLRRANTFRAAERVGLLVVFVCASILNVMILRIGEGALYGINLHLVAIGGLSFIPWRARYFFVVVIMIYGPYLARELYLNDQPGGLQQLSVNIFFILGVILITWVIKTFRERLHEREIAIRIELENEIQKRKQTEQDLVLARDQALEATRAKESFLANMSHEIRTPLTAIIGFADTAVDQDQTTEQRLSALKIIRRSGDHLLSLINDILDLSKVEAGELQIETIPANPLQLVAEVESIIIGQAKRKGLDFGIDYEFPLPGVIQSDPVRIKQILLNLCSNAIKFTDTGSVRIAVRYDVISHKLLFLIKDTGIGMTSEQLGMIFKPFKQADSSTARRFGGTGLGLSLSKHLAEKLGGQLTVRSEKGKGSIFEFCLNLGPAVDAKLITNIEQVSFEPDSPENSGDAMLLAGRILLAEDNKTNQQLIKMYLERMGASVSCADNGAIAVNLAMQNSYDLIYMDMQMPVMSGLDAVRELRAKAYSRPVVMLTANATYEDKSECLRVGADDFVTKPIVRQRLYEVTARYLRPAEKGVGTRIYSTLLESEPEMVELLEGFIVSLKAMYGEIIGSYQQGDTKRFRQLIHDLKGTAGGYGYPQLTQLASEIEVQNRGDDAGSIPPLLDKLNVLCESIYAGFQDGAKPG